MSLLMHIPWDEPGEKVMIISPYKSSMISALLHSIKLVPKTKMIM
jgi:hypothetical protein